MTITNIGIVGSGAWGTALATSLAANGREVILWGRKSEIVDSINATHLNPLSLPGIALAPSLKATRNSADLRNTSMLMFAVPTQHLRGVCNLFTDEIKKDTSLVVCSKGIERKTCRMPVDIVKDCLPNTQVSVLSGPTFAHEVAQGLPAAITLACTENDEGHLVIGALSSPTLRPYLSNDLVGVQLGGALKNVIAIAAGIVYGCSLGENARAAIISRGLSETMRLGVALGAKPETLMGLSGLGDLVLTCSSPKSRNFSLGVAIAKGSKAADYLAEQRTVAEGAFTAEAAVALAARYDVELPITTAITMLLEGQVPVKELIDNLLSRPLRSEND